MQKKILIIFTIIFTSLSAKGVKIDSLSLIRDSYYYNPSFNFYRHSSTISSFSLGANSESKNIYLLQQGKGFDGFSVNASSWMSLNDKNKIWGDVSYRKGKRKDVSWSETSDSHLLYPYLMADSVGGDLSGQRYTFNGGYAGKINNLILGAELGYRAEIESRNVDPRPRNIISDLMAKVGLSYNINRYQAGATLSFSSYNQKNDVDFYSQLGDAYMHTMTGLGNTYARFDGSRTSAEYTGNNYVAAFQIRPINNYGLWGNIAYEIDNKSRNLTSENNIPITEMKVSKYKASLAYQHKIDGRSEAGISVEADITERNGKENLFNSGNGVSMEIIGSREPYKENIRNISMHLFYKNMINKMYSITLKPYSAIIDSETKHDDNGRYMKFTRWSFGSAIENDINFNDWQLVITADGGYHPVSKSALSLVSLSHKGVEEMLTHNYNVLAADRINFAISSAAYLPQKGYTLYAKAAWKYENYSSDYINNRYTKKNNNNIELNIGILF